MSISRRHFTTLAGTVTVGKSIPIYAADGLTARAFAERLQMALGGDWSATGVDGFKAGDPSTTVKGVATTAMATMDVLKQAVKAKTNAVLTYEPTFFGRSDGPAPSPSSPPAGTRFPGGLSASDPVYKAKQEFIENNGLVIFRLHEHWESRRQGEMTTGLADALGWSKYRLKPDDCLYDIPPVSAEEMVAAIRRRLKLRGGLRAVGDKRATIRRVLLYPGFMTPLTMWNRYADADVILTGEVREWENTHYAADLFTAGEKRALVTIGRVASEDPGMRACAAWLRTIVDDIPVQWIPVGDLYWRPV